MDKPGKGTPDVYDRISAAYDLIADPAEHGVRERGLALLDAQPGERVLDLGAGTGSALPLLAARVGERGLVCGLDASAGMLARARPRAAEGNIALQRGDARRLPYRQAAFDAAFTSFTLELFEPPDVSRVLSELRCVLKPRGRLLVVSLDLPEEPGLAVSAYRWLHARFPHWIDCRPIPVLKLLGQAGYRTVRNEALRLWGLAIVAALAVPREARPLSGESSPRARTTPR
jgi:demethylmenaquinone methyltransferase/2-methoxy-6-polyprenyl-1,4-benzoquinol methylase